MPVHAPWALAVGQRRHQRYGLDGSAMAADDIAIPAIGSHSLASAALASTVLAQQNGVTLPN